MTNVEAPIAPAPEADTSIEAPPAVEAPQEPAAPTGPALDFETYSGHLVPVKVNGEESLVPLSELQAGYSRQADYTAKTQQLADERRALAHGAAIAQGLAQDPVGTIKVLTEVYGVDGAAEVVAQATDAAQTATPAAPEAQDPLSQRLGPIEAWVQEQQQQAALAQLQSTLDRVTEQFGVTADDVVMRAMQLDTDDLETVAKVLAFEQGAQASQAQATAAAAQAAQVQQRTEDKRAAAVVHAAGTNQTTSVSPPHKPTFEEAAAAAAAQLGISLD